MPPASGNPRWATFQRRPGMIPAQRGAAGNNLNTLCGSADGISAGSGGPSGINAGAFAGYSKPSFQNGMTQADGARDVPDVSLFASTGKFSKSFYVVCQSDQIQQGNPPSCAPGTDGAFSLLGVGGTSASAPSFAGILALIEQSERSRVPGSTGRQGNANFVLYKLAAGLADGNGIRLCCWAGYVKRCKPSFQMGRRSRHVQSHDSKPEAKRWDASTQSHAWRIGNSGGDGRS
jgi:hypothetical protein